MRAKNPPPDINDASAVYGQIREDGVLSRWTDNFSDGDGDTFECRTCTAELPNSHRGRCPWCGERP